MNAHHEPADSIIVSDDDQLIPPRYWWLKRAGSASVLFVLAVMSINVWVRHSTERKVQALIDTYRAAGQPVYPNDFNPIDSAPDDQNAAILYDKAAAAYCWPDSFPRPWSEYSSFLKARFVLDHASAADHFIATNGAALALLRQASDRPAIDWGDRVTSPMIDFGPADLRNRRYLASLAVQYASILAAHGNCDQATEWLVDHILLAQRTWKGSTCLVEDLLAMSFLNRTIHQIEVILPGTIVADGREAEMGNSCLVPRERLEYLIDLLMDETPSIESWRTAYYFARAMNFDVLVNYLVTKGGTATVGRRGAPGSFFRALGSYATHFGSVGKKTLLRWPTTSRVAARLPVMTAMPGTSTMWVSTAVSKGLMTVS